MRMGHDHIAGDRKSMSQVTVKVKAWLARMLTRAVFLVQPRLNNIGKDCYLPSAAEHIRRQKGEHINGRGCISRSRQ